MNDDISLNKAAIIRRCLGRIAPVWPGGAGLAGSGRFSDHSLGRDFSLYRNTELPTHAPTGPAAKA
jgi:hypothetical protein